MDLFQQSKEQELFCPLDGTKLALSEWEWCGSRLKVCANQHVWEARWHHMWKNQLQFDSIEMTRCECGQIVPKQLLEHANFDTENVIQKGKERKVCPTCFEKIKEAWRPDLEQSYARLVIHPIRRGDVVVFRYEEEIQIKPYPNPLGGGGSWGGGTVTTEAEVDELIKDFTGAKAPAPFIDDYYLRWQKLGVKFEVIRHEEVTQVEYRNIRQVEEAEEKGEEVGTLRLL